MSDQPFLPLQLPVERIEHCKGNLALCREVRSTYQRLRLQIQLGSHFKWLTKQRNPNWQGLVLLTRIDNVSDFLQWEVEPTFMQHGDNVVNFRDREIGGGISIMNCSHPAIVGPLLVGCYLTNSVPLNVFFQPNGALLLSASVEEINKVRKSVWDYDYSTHRANAECDSIGQCCLGDWRTPEEIAEFLVAKFPEKDPDKIKSTINAQLAWDESDKNTRNGYEHGYRYFRIWNVNHWLYHSEYHPLNQQKENQMSIAELSNIESDSNKIVRRHEKLPWATVQEILDQLDKLGCPELVAAVEIGYSPSSFNEMRKEGAAVIVVYKALQGLLFERSPPIVREQFNSAELHQLVVHGGNLPFELKEKIAIAYAKSFSTSDTRR